MSEAAAVTTFKPVEIAQLYKYVPSTTLDLSTATTGLAAEPTPSIIVIVPAAVVFIVTACKIPLPLNTCVEVPEFMFVA